MCRYSKDLYIQFINSILALKSGDIIPLAQELASPFAFSDQNYQKKIIKLMNLFMSLMNNGKSEVKLEEFLSSKLHANIKQISDTVSINPSDIFIAYDDKLKKISVYLLKDGMTFDEIWTACDLFDLSVCNNSLLPSHYIKFLTNGQFTHKMLLEISKYPEQLPDECNLIIDDCKNDGNAGLICAHCNKEVSPEKYLLFHKPNHGMKATHLLL